MNLSFSAEPLVFFCRAIIAMKIMGLVGSRYSIEKDYTLQDTVLARSGYLTNA